MLEQGWCWECLPLARFVSDAGLCDADILQIVRDNQDLDLTNENGEVELDFDALTPGTLWKLYDFTQRTATGANGVADDSDGSDSESDGEF